MKIEISTDTLKDALSRISTIPGSKMSMISSQAVIITASEFMGVYIERRTSEARMQINCKASVLEDGEIAIDSNVLTRFLSTIKEDTIQLASSPMILSIDGAKNKIKIPILPEHELYGSKPLPTAKATMTIPAEMLCTAFAMTLPAASKPGGVKKELEGICFRRQNDKMSIFGADGRRVHVAWIEGPKDDIEFDFEHEKDSGAMISAPAAQAIRNVITGEAGDCQIQFTDNKASFTTAGALIEVVLNSNLPPYIDQFLLPKTIDNEITVERESFVKALRHATQFSADEGLEIQVSAKHIQVKALNYGTEFITEEPCEARRSGIYVANGHYLRDMIECAQEEQVTLTAHENRIFNIVHPKYSAVLMLKMRIAS